MSAPQYYRGAAHFWRKGGIGGNHHGNKLRGPDAVRQRADIQFNIPNGRKVRIADFYAKRSEGPVFALHVEMCMGQNLLLSALGVE